VLGEPVSWICAVNGARDQSWTPGRTISAASAASKTPAWTWATFPPPGLLGPGADRQQRTWNLTEHLAQRERGPQARGGDQVVPAGMTCSRSGSTSCSATAAIRSASARTYTLRGTGRPLAACRRP
jgi:hypothetical protein